MKEYLIVGQDKNTNEIKNLHLKCYEDIFDLNDYIEEKNKSDYLFFSFSESVIIIDVVKYCQKFFNAKIEDAKLNFKNLIEDTDEITQTLDNWEDQICRLKRELYDVVKTAENY